jgi:hypothetical protein
LELDEASLVQLVTQRSALLAEAGFAMLLPSGLRQGQRLAMRARALAAPVSKRGKAAPSGGGAGLDLTRMFSFEWQAVLGDRPLSAAELASLERAAALKRPRRSRARRRAQTFVTSHTSSTGSPGFGLSPSRS